jgi:signal peptidase I
VSAVSTTDEHEPVTSTPVPARPYGRTRLAVGLIGRSWLWFVVGCLLVTLLPMLFGWRPYVVESGSMLPRIHVGDVVLASPVAASDRKELLGRVTVFDSPEVPGKLITHRVVRFAGSQMVTKGDANAGVDSGKITMASVRGLGRLLVKWVGLPLIWLQTGQWQWMLLFLASLTLAVMALLQDQEEDRNDLDPDDLDPDDLDPDDLDSDGGDPAEPGEPVRPGDRPAGTRPGTAPAAPAYRTVRRWRGAGLRMLRSHNRRRPVWLLRAIVVLGSGLLLILPSSFAAFAATTKDNTNSWTVPNWVYPTEVNNLTPYLYWRFEETGIATTAADSSGNGRTGTYNPSGAATNFTRQATGALVTDLPDNSVALASANACINTTSTTAIAAQNTLTEIIWFKAAAGYTAGGKLLGFENPRTGVGVAGSGGTYDRHIYMDGNGRIWYGVYNGAAVVISSGTGLNDGTWHMAAATLGAAGMHLYIDGVQVAQNLATTVGEATTGFWRVGCGNLSGWAVGWTGVNPPPASATASNYVFQGSVDEATVFTSQLTATQIAFLYWIR